MMNLHYLSYLAKLGATDLHPKGRRATSWLIDSLNLEAGHRVLEIGCGTAGAIVRIALFHSVSIDGLDILPEMIRAAKTRLQLTRNFRNKANLFLSGTGASLPFSDQTYDRVYTESVLGFQDAVVARAMLAEIFRVLKRGGLYVANEAIWKNTASAEVVAAINQVSLADFGLRQASELAWYLDDWLNLMSEVGFEVVAAHRLEDYHEDSYYTSSKQAWRKFVISNVLTRYYHIKGYLSPKLLRQRSEFQKLLKEHHLDGQYIEARGFILKKP